VAALTSDAAPAQSSASCRSRRGCPECNQRRGRKGSELTINVRNFGELGEGGLKVFYDLKLVCCPRSLDPTLVTVPSMSLIPSAPFSGDDVENLGVIECFWPVFFFPPASTIQRFNGLTI